MFSALHMDDFTGSFCGLGRYPLLTALNEELWRPTTTTDSQMATQTDRCACVCVSVSARERLRALVRAYCLYALAIH